MKTGQMVASSVMHRTRNPSAALHVSSTSVTMNFEELIPDSQKSVEKAPRSVRIYLTKIYV